MKVRFSRVDTKPGGYTTVGYWSWNQPSNHGTLHIQVAKMCDWRFELAVWGHEIIEAAHCKLFGKTTEECDKFDSFYEGEYESGKIPITKEPGHDPQCPYHIGHMMGVCWEYVAIYGTFASWNKYERECNRIMEIPNS